MVSADYTGESRESLKEKYKNTLKEYENLIQEVPSTSIWPDVSNAFSDRREKLVHVNLFRISVVNIILHNNPTAFATSSVLERVSLS